MQRRQSERPAHSAPGGDRSGLFHHFPLGLGQAGLEGQGALSPRRIPGGHRHLVGAVGGRQRDRFDLLAVATVLFAIAKLEMVGLTPRDAEKFPSELSGGMIKRVALARAIIMDPKLLFFDEPSAGLDPVSAKQLDDLIIEINRSLGATVVIVTHDPDLGRRTPRQVRMLDGRIEDDRQGPA